MIGRLVDVDDGSGYVCTTGVDDSGFEDSDYYDNHDEDDGLSVTVSSVYEDLAGIDFSGRSTSSNDTSQQHTFSQQQTKGTSTTTYQYMPSSTRSDNTVPSRPLAHPRCHSRSNCPPPPPPKSISGQPLVQRPVEVWGQVVGAPVRRAWEGRGLRVPPGMRAIDLVDGPKPVGSPERGFRHEYSAMLRTLNLQ